MLHGDYIPGFFSVLLAFKACGHLGDLIEARIKLGFRCLRSQSMATAPACVWLHTETGCAEGPPVLLSHNPLPCVLHFCFPLVWPVSAGRVPVPSLPLMPGSLFLQMQVEGRSIDFIRHNACSAKRAPLRRSQSLQALAQLLQHRQQEQEQYNARQKGHVPQ